MFGASTDKSKNVVQNARQAREERALLKRKETALLKIQAVVRGFIVRRRIYREWIAEIDEAIGYEELRKNPPAKKYVSEKVQTNVSRGRKQESTSNWGFQSFSTTKLMGTYSNLSIKIGPEDETQTSTESSNVSKKSKPESLNTEASDAAVKTDSNDSALNLTPIKKAMSGVDLLLIARKLLFIMELDRDKWRYERLCRSVLENCNSDRSVKTSYCSLCLNKKHAIVWVQQVKRILRTCCKYLESVNPQEHHSARMANICLNMMILLTDASSWKLVKV